MHDQGFRPQQGAWGGNSGFGQSSGGMQGGMAGSGSFGRPYELPMDPYSSTGYGSQQGGQFGGGGQYGGSSGQFGGSGFGGQQGGSYGGSSMGSQGGYGGGMQYSGPPQGGGFQGGQFQGSQRSDVTFNRQTMDKDYDLISVLYHALQAAETCARYCEDARREGSQEVAWFMQQVQQNNQQIALRAKELLFRQRQV